MRFLSWHFLENGPAGVGILSRGTRTVFSMGYDTMSPRYYQFLFREVASQPLVDQNQVCFCRQRSREGVPLSCIEHEKPGVGRRAGNDVDLRVASFAEVGPSFSGVAGCRLGVASCQLRWVGSCQLLVARCELVIFGNVYPFFYGEFLVGYFFRAKAAGNGRGLVILGS